MDGNTPAATFHIDFDSRDMPGKLVATSVTLAQEIFDTKTELAAFEQRTFRIDLSLHPLYPKLCAYVAANPPRVPR